MFNNTEIQRFELYENIRDKFDAKGTFDSIDGFKDRIKNYIFTDITLTDHTHSIEEAFQSRLQLLQSETLLRCLMLKEGMVNALNSNNFPAYYAALKAFLEIPAVLGYVTHLIYSDEEYKAIISKMSALHLGNREAGSLSVGETKAINVLTMFDKLDRVLKDIACEGKTESEAKKIKEDEGVMATIYSDICNFGHVNFNANLSIGILHGDIWKAKKDVDGYKGELWAFYMPSFHIGMDIICLLCGLIMKNEKVDNYSLLANPKYFVED